MYLIDIVIDQNKVAGEQAETMLNAHRQWFAKYFQSGNFLMLGPYLDQAAAGVIIAQCTDRAELDRILAEDVYYPDLARYIVREFKATMVAENVE
ncbi:YciI family protein [Actinobacillus vicugnae]|uniref:YciI family protein n=1 Tax=Actinobacillus vicugnae TaxID=2573093 RepID=UPI00123F96D5|nr:YciI family protein [Actinobacillus vicugnae]